MINKIAKRFSDIAAGRNSDSSDEYYTLYHSFMALFLEILCRYHDGTKYKVIICPCDSETSIFRELENYKDLIGNPRTIYSFYPEKSWEDYFDMDYEKEFGCKAEECLIFTNPPFKGLSGALPKIKCDYLVFGSNVVSMIGETYAKDAKVNLYRKNNEEFTGNADEFDKDKYGAVCTYFYSNRPFLSYGRQYKNNSEKKENLLFGKDRLEQIR